MSGLAETSALAGRSADAAIEIALRREGRAGTADHSDERVASTRKTVSTVGTASEAGHSGRGHPSPATSLFAKQKFSVGRTFPPKTSANTESHPRSVGQTDGVLLRHVSAPSSLVLAVEHEPGWHVEISAACGQQTVK